MQNRDIGSLREMKSKPNTGDSSTEIAQSIMTSRSGPRVAIADSIVGVVSLSPDVPPSVVTTKRRGLELSWLFSRCINASTISARKSFIQTTISAIVFRAPGQSLLYMRLTGCWKTQKVSYCIRIEKRG
ncbi:hypothetical protein ElyMa_003810800 [Elysia marginata]|uniref:Uncharacterized protein n=1 Tax=Elysia marginata TaxID=1093978 RepID=A0AAV4FDR9_9GAST|nr:hypothetical protein ElyMa_003810800 [Elysia marginata]